MRKQDIKPVTTEPQLAQTADPYEFARCGLPGMDGPCGADLHIVWTADRSIYLSDTARDIGSPDNAALITWEVVCEAGHTVLVPPDTAEESYMFGGCNCDPEDGPSPDQFCGHGDLVRLRAVLAPVAAQFKTSTDDNGGVTPNA
jgi:hypothetical protein